MEVNIYIGLWTLKMKCTQFGLYRQATFKNVRAILFSEVGQNMQECCGGCPKVPDSGPLVLIHHPMNVCRGQLVVAPKTYTTKTRV